MVRGIESFREWFHGYEDQYAIIGGTACDLLMADEGYERIHRAHAIRNCRFETAWDFERIEGEHT